MNLEALRNYRRQIEESLRAELALLQRNLDLAVGERHRLEALAEEGATEYLSAAEAGVRSAEASQRYEALDGLAAKIRSVDEQFARAQQECDVKRGEVVDAARETKKLELLWQRKLRKERREQVRREQRAVDESAARRFFDKKHS